MVMGFLSMTCDQIRSAMDAFHAELFKSDCFADENLHVLHNYRDVELPFSHAQRIEFDLQQQSTMDQLIGFLSSVSMFRSYAAKCPENTLMQTIKANYKATRTISDVEEFTFPGFVIVGMNK